MRFWALVGMLVLVGTVIWQYMTPASVDTTAATLTDHPVVASYVVNGTRTHFSADGNAADVLKIDTATRWSQTDRTELTGIQYFANGEDGQQWQIEAAEGDFFEAQNELALTNGVKIEELNEQAVMKTDAMRLFLDEKRASGINPVTLTGQGSVTTGSSFELDLNTSTATLQGDVTTHYE